MDCRVLLGKHQVMQGRQFSALEQQMLGCTRARCVSVSIPTMLASLHACRKHEFMRKVAAERIQRRLLLPPPCPSWPTCLWHRMNAWPRGRTWRAWYKYCHQLNLCLSLVLTFGVQPALRHIARNLPWPIWFADLGQDNSDWLVTTWIAATMIQAVGFRALHSARPSWQSAPRSCFNVRQGGAAIMWSARSWTRLLQPSRGRWLLTVQSRLQNRMCGKTC